MSTLIRIAFAVAAAASLVAQAPAGRISGRITDKERGALPGVRLRIAQGDQTREAITDREGRFSVAGLTIGAHRVAAELAGFKAVSATITLSRSTPAAFLAWSLEIGCIAEIQRVILGPRYAARLVDSIVHVRVTSPASSLLVSAAPGCREQVVHEYSAQVLSSAAGRTATSAGPGQMLLEPSGAPLTVGQEYVALLWHDWQTTPDLVLPIVSGRVVSPGASELHGLTVSEALHLLAEWSKAGARS